MKLANVTINTRNAMDTAESSSQIVAPNAASCMSLCSRNILGYNQPQCQAVEYMSATQTCRLRSQRVYPNGNGKGADLLSS
jgi:hypothetical protein